MNSGLLSRIAETLFWIGRYVERADDTARMVDVYVRSPSAIAGAVLAARVGARSVRDVISSEMWECLNVTGLGLASQRRAAERLGQHVYLRFIRERAALFFGLADSTMSHDEAWRFLLLGRSLERVDMTARLLQARMPDTPYEVGWPMLLRACGAYESFIRSHGWTGGEGEAAEFLILDRLFPRSVLHSLATAEDCLASLDPEAGRAGMADPARRPIGALRTRLEYSRTQLPPDQLAALLGDLQETCLQATEAITDRYFSYAESVAWANGG